MLEEHPSKILHKYLTSHPVPTTPYTNLPELLSWQQDPFVLRLSVMMMNACGDNTNFTTDISWM